MRKDQLEPSEDRQPAYPVLPIRNSVLFPNLILPLSVGRASSLAAIDTALAAEDKTIVVVAQRDPTTDEVDAEDLYEVGTLATIKKIERQDDAMHLLVFGTDRVELGEVESREPYLRVKIRRLPRPKDKTTEVDALHREVLEVTGRISELLASHTPVALIDVVMQTKDMIQQLYLLASLLSIDVSKAQALLAAPTRQDALEKMHEFLSYELQVLELRHKIASQASTEIGREQREYLLRQQMKAIQEELGGKSPEEAETDELRRRLEEAQLPEKAHKEAEKELRRLERMSPNAADYQVTRTYLDLVLELPWHKLTEDNLELPRARTILDEDHFNLKEVKQRIVEHLAVMKLNPEAKAPILCFVGPPGVGKTSLGQSIARALGREFERLALGGLHDEAELRGHRRTYIGAMPGRILQAIRRAGVRNPLLMLDEIDKLGRDYRGDPAAALMEGPHGSAAFAGIQRRRETRNRGTVLDSAPGQGGGPDDRADRVPPRDGALPDRPLHARGGRPRTGTDPGPDRPQGRDASRRGPHRAGGNRRRGLGRDARPGTVSAGKGPPATSAGRSGRPGLDRSRRRCAVRGSAAAAQRQGPEAHRPIG
ncbi:MAG: LON peptidase substrate-binding domain-containing protein [Pirellulaceae bacterium]|nr:LON peptidase substrate-binding domain-containing protein [Pirellulaceae bacterium]